jgi:peptidyl-prolyl cis-trans isomerase SurA
VLKIKYLCAAALLAAAPLTVADELSDTGEFVDGIAAIVNEGVVLKSKLRDEVAAIVVRAGKEQLQLPPTDILEEQVLERLIVTEVQMQRADLIGLQISDQMLNESIGRIASANNVTFEDMPAVLAEDGVSYQDFRRSLREELTLDQLKRIDVGQRISVSPRELDQCLADLDGNVAVKSEYNLSHILIEIPEAADADQIAETEALAQRVYLDIQNGADFGEMAIRHSDHQTSSLQGGALGWLIGAQIPTIYSDVVVGLEVGEVSAPFRSSNSFHIVIVNELRSADQRSEIEQVNVRHILVTPNEIIDDETAKQKLEEAIEKIEAGEDFGELAKLLSDDPGSVNSGGDMGWTGPGTFVTEFDNVVETTEMGTVSEPFKSRFGWHIVEVLGRRVYDNTEDLKESDCGMRIRNSKMDEETQAWSRRLRDEAFIDIRI